MKKDKNNQNINSIPKYLWGNYFKKPIKWLAHLINNYGNSKHPFITAGTSYAYVIGDEKRKHPELTEQQVREIVNLRIKQNRKKLRLPTDNNITPSLTAAGLALGSFYYPWLAIPDIIFDTAASIDEPSTSNNLHTIADFPETVAKFTPSKIDDYVAKGVLTLGNIDDAVSTSGRNMFSNFDKKPGKINNTTDKTSVRESTNIRYRKNGGQIRKMLTASGGPIYWLRKKLYNNIEPFGYNDVGSRFINAVVLNKNEHDNFKGNYSDPEKAPALYLTIDNIWGEYLHIPEKERRYSNGKYKIKNNKNGTFSLPFESMEDIMQTVNSNNPLLWGLKGKLGNSVIGEYDVHRGYDRNGDYLKYIDHWRINPYDVKENKEYGLDDNSILKWYFKGKDDASFGLGTPVEIQGKYYLDDIYNVKGKDRGGHYLPEIIVTGKKKQGGKMNILEFLKNGSGIHIKEKNKGKFTSYCGGKVTDECILKGKNSSNPAIRKRATFAANARKWKHLEGGSFKGYPSKAAYDVRLEEVAGFKKGGIIKAEEGTKTNWWSKIGNGLKNFGESKVGQLVISLGLSTIFGGGNSSNNDISKVAEDFNNSKLESINLLRLLNLEYAKNLLESKSDPNNPNATEGVFKNYVLGLINNMYYGELQKQQRLKEELLNQYKKDLETNKWMSIVQGAALEIPSYFSKKLA